MSILNSKFRIWTNLVRWILTRGLGMVPMRSKVTETASVPIVRQPLNVLGRDLFLFRRILFLFHILFSLFPFFCGMIGKISYHRHVHLIIF
jgi:hypothetical protein